MSNDEPPGAEPNAGHPPSAQGRTATGGNSRGRFADAARSAGGVAAKLVFNKYTFAAACVGALLFIAAWVAGMPSGELRIASFPSISEDDQKMELARSMFQRADAAVADAERYHKQLSFAAATGTYDVVLPPSAGPRDSSIKQFVPDISVETSGEIGGTSFGIKYDALELWQKSYEWVGATDYYVVFRDLEPEDCPDGTSMGCWRMVAQYWPSQMRPVELIGTEEDLVRDLAVLVMRGAAHNKGVAWRRVAALTDPPPFLLANSTPTTMKALEATAKGMEILTLGESHPDCQGKSETECIDLARSEFELSFDRAKTLNPVGAYGVALIELDASTRAARNFAPQLEVENHLSHAENWTGRARASEFLRSIMNSDAITNGFGLLELDGLAPGEDLIDLARQFACALADYRRANWNKCRAQIDDVTAFPAPLRPYLEAALLDSVLSVAATSSTEFTQQIESLKMRLPISGATNSHDRGHLFMLRKVLIRHTCGRQDILDTAKFEDVAKAAAHGALTETMHYEATILAAACRQAQSYPKQSKIADIVVEVNQMPESIELRHYELLLSAYWLRKGELDTALSLAIRALELPWAGSFVRQASEFHPLITSDPHGDEFIGESFSSSSMMDLESCYRLQ